MEKIYYDVALGLLYRQVVQNIPPEVGGEEFWETVEMVGQLLEHRKQEREEE